MEQPQFSVSAGTTSMEVELIAEATPTSQSIISAQQTPSPPLIEQAEMAQPKPIETPCEQKPQPIQGTTKKERPQKESSTVAKGVKKARPDYLRNPAPVYPSASRLAHEEGVAILLITISASGDAMQIKLQQSSSYRRLDEAALRAVRNWKFHPAILGGIPVESQVAVPVRFELR